MEIVEYPRDCCISVANMLLCDSTEEYVTLATAIASNGIKADYDSQCKKLLSEKIILAWILKYCVEEFTEFAVDEIATKYIETAEVSMIPVFQDEKYSEDASYMNESGTRVIGMSNEDVSSNEGTVRYDIKFKANAPVKERVITLHIDIEGQKNFYPGYPLTMRGVYYGSRMISSQYGEVFTHSEYEKLNKVYTIWICSNPSVEKQNTITKYSIAEQNIVGEITEKRENYDLINIVMVCLGDSNKTENMLLKLLDTLFVDKISTTEKIKRLEEEYKIPVTSEVHKEVNTMCNFSEGIEERGIIKGKKEGIKEGKKEGKKEGIKEGKKEGIREGIYALVATLEELNIATEVIRDQVMSRFGLTESEVKEYL